MPLSSCDFTRRINRKILARLACLIHADNVHSEPGSNPSNDCLAVMSKLITEQSERKVDPMHPSQDGCKDHTATVSNVNDQPFSARILLTGTDPDQSRTRLTHDQFVNCTSEKALNTKRPFLRVSNQVVKEQRQSHRSRRRCRGAGVCTAANWLSTSSANIFRLQ